MTKPNDETERRRKAAETIKQRAARKAKARAEGRSAVWFGLGMFGLIGWAIAVPTLIGVVLGVWLDRIAPVDFSWTLALLLAGVVLGTVNAWLWVEKERKRHNDH